MIIITKNDNNDDDSVNSNSKCKSQPLGTLHKKGRFIECINWN